MQLLVMEHCGYGHGQISKRFAQRLGNSWHKNQAEVEHGLMQSMPRGKDSKT